MSLKHRSVWLWWKHSSALLLQPLALFPFLSWSVFYQQNMHVFFCYEIAFWAHWHMLGDTRWKAVAPTRITDFLGHPHISALCWKPVSKQLGISSSIRRKFLPLILHRHSQMAISPAIVYNLTKCKSNPQACHPHSIWLLVFVCFVSSDCKLLEARTVFDSVWTAEGSQSLHSQVP